MKMVDVLMDLWVFVRDNRRLLFLLFVGVLFFVMTFAAAVALPSLDVVVPGEVDSFVGQDTFFNITLSNLGDQALYNLSFSDMRATYFPSVFSLGVGEVRDVVVRVSPGGVFSQDYVLVMSYFYELLSVGGGDSYGVVLGQDNFSVSALSVFVNDSVIFNNSLSSDVTVRDFNGLWGDFVVPAGRVVNVTFPVNNSYKFYVVGLGYTLDVVVSSGVVGSLAHSNDLDVEKNVRLVSSYVPGDLVVDVLTDTLVVDHDGVVEGVVNVVNDGVGDARDIVLSSDSSWLSFEDDFFSVASGSNRVVRFFVEPVNISSTVQTNISYSLSVFAEGSNTLVAGDGLGVFVRFNDFGNLSVGNATYIIHQLSVEESIALCSQNMDYPGCDDLIIVVEREKIVELNASYELSESAVLDIGAAAGRVDDSFLRVENKFNSIGSDIDMLTVSIGDAVSSINDIEVLVSDLLVEVELERRSARNARIVRNIFGWLLFFGVIIFVFVRNYGFRRKVHNELYGEGGV